MPTRIEICGGIATGKTTLAKLLSELPARPIFENFRVNPFWKAFYANPGQHIFETEVTFVLQHYHLLKLASSCREAILVSDFSTALDAAYAQIGLSGAKLRAFESVRRETIRDLKMPSVLVHLQCSAPTELSRIRARARKEEALINLPFLRSLNRAVQGQVDLTRNSTRVVELNSEKVNFADDPSARANVLTVIAEAVGATARTERGHKRSLRL